VSKALEQLQATIAIQSILLYLFLCHLYCHLFLWFLSVLLYSFLEMAGAASKVEELIASARFGSFVG
jgi:hypothetical protein